jgi:predicted adenylyl cyclase CyaB
LVKIEDAKGIKDILTKACGIKVIVKKKREIYYIGNVKFHIDEVPALGSFVEIEAGNIFKDFSREQLQQQCEFYMSEFKITNEDLVEISYSDMLLKESVV